MVEKLHGFAEGKYEVPDEVNAITSMFLERRGDAGERVEELSITKRITSTGEPTSTGYQL